jgi:hypothetical protein
MEKQCSICGETKPLDGFYNHPKMPDGRQKRCKDCCKAAAVENWKANRERNRAYDKQRFQRPERKAAIGIYQKRRRQRFPQDASGCSETVTTNSIVRKLGSDGASRWAHFSVNGFVIVSLTQKADEAMLTMASPAAAWTSSYSFGDNQIAHAELQAEALRQAIELAREWAVDAGRPYKEVLR